MIQPAPADGEDASHPRVPRSRGAETRRGALRRAAPFPRYKDYQLGSRVCSSLSGGTAAVNRGKRKPVSGWFACATVASSSYNSRLARRTQDILIIFRARFTVERLPPPISGFSGRSSSARDDTLAHLRVPRFFRTVLPLVVTRALDFTARVAPRRNETVFFVRSRSASRVISATRILRPDQRG